MTTTSWAHDNDPIKEPRKVRQFKEIVPYKLKPGRVPGKILVLKMYHRHDKSVGEELRKWPEVAGYERYNVCRGNSKYQALSPMILGPVMVDTHVASLAGPARETGYHDEKPYAFNIEDAWQCSKVFRDQVGADGYPMEDWYYWTKQGRASNYAQRHRGKGLGPCQYSWFNREKLGYVEARKKLYCPWYAELVVKTKAFQDLKNRHDSGINLLLVEFDGIDRDDTRPLTEARLKTMLNDENQIFGHGLVLACVLMGIEPWRE